MSIYNIQYVQNDMQVHVISAHMHARTYEENSIRTGSDEQMAGC